MAEGTVTVYNLDNPDRIVYYAGITPAQAVMCAYAQMDRRDFNTWEYENKYSSLVKESELMYFCGNWAAYKEGVVEEMKNKIFAGKGR